MSYKLTPVLPTKFGFGEGPLWDVRRQRLIFADCFAKTVVQYDPKTGTTESKVLPLDSVPYFAVAVPIENSSKFVLAAYDKLVEWDWDRETNYRTLFEINKPDPKYGDTRPATLSDAKCDAQGRLWAGTYVADDIGKQEVVKNAGKLHRFHTETNGSVVESTQAGEYDVPNGLTWNRENTKLFHCDLNQRSIKIYDFDLVDGKAENQRTFFDFTKYPNLNGYADGLTADWNGNLWLACWKGGCVIKIDGVTGQLIETIRLPVDNVTSLIFGNEKFNTLYVTTTSIELNQSEVKGQPEAGKLFAITSEKDHSFRGFPTSCFN